mmetsp:Transcript_22443/g.35117  ORF Transcript_22443/g.35117 Transcript_22443/m.35117 type:complete len:248 (+) Transcript_22443:128-871(+)|eukprot:CAMPEP_0184330746 /NCGR_PEP_ID=MMETSP1049-20130417/144845_1 /TAXON_ID=77928 /ORGANISM="Proteomonas sulcata, Strain CCMP704" /LENGTH=247 /DNA_ID=CAMNT_0026653199 /DNA_START=27 /DNA_END=770 /DNA_ORIENTATION=+
MVEVNWSRQLVILVLAALFAFYWTGKQGLWDALRGSTPWDKEWTDAKSALQRRLSGRFELIDGKNQRGEQRVLVLAWPKRDDVAQSAQNKSVPPAVAAEMFPIPPAPFNPRKAAKEKQKKKMERDKKKDKESRKTTRTRPGRGKEELVSRDPVAKLRIYDPQLDYLKDMFGKDAAKSMDRLIELTEPKEGSTAKDQQKLPTGGIPKDTKKASREEIEKELERLRAFERRSNMRNDDEEDDSHIHDEF